LTQHPDSVKFKYSWRKYQQRVLDELHDHLSDQHLHIVAPPGSGKTVLGLEVVVRLNKPALILVPTLAIRNQWINRFCDLFLATPERPEWISRDIRKRAFLTVTTYQALHAACADESPALGEDEEEEIDDEADVTDIANEQTVLIASKMDVIAKALKDHGIQAIVVDEAHHLKNEWWAALTEIKRRLEPRIIALTATPPFDVSPTEWQRYIEFAGPVDREILVPELMLEGDLCPHQDLIFFTRPLPNEEEKLSRFRLDSEKLFQELKTGQIIIEAIQKHPIWVAPMDQLDWIYSNLSYYSARLVFMKANGYEVPPGHIEIIGDISLVIPALDYHWMQILLEFYLLKDREHFKIQGNIKPGFNIT
jgi:superfamily II DNA or RNA helicase